MKTAKDQTVYVKNTVFYLDPYPEIWPNLNADADIFTKLHYQFWRSDKYFSPNCFLKEKNYFKKLYDYNVKQRRF